MLAILMPLAGATCPQGTGGGSCIDCSGVACMNQYNETICKGHYSEDYKMYFMWMSSSDTGCTCYCPYSLYLEATGYACKGTSCPDRCNGAYLEAGGVCDIGSGACSYATRTYCDLGCDSTALACVKKADLCSGKACENVCEGGYTLKRDGKCEPSTGECYYDNSVHCEFGCDAESAKKGACKEEDKCASVTCKDKCIDADYLGLGDSATCDKYTGGCDYSNSKKKCAYGCDLQKDECKEPEICDNQKDDDFDGYTDCEDPDCKDSIDCVCKKMEGTAFRTMGYAEKPSSKNLNIIFVGTAYDAIYPKADTREARFLANVRTATTALFDTVPFSSERPRIAVYSTMVPQKDAKREGVIRAIASARCNAPANSQYIIYDPIGSATDCGHADICGNTATVYTSCDVATTTLHEFGHSFGCLWDEYTYGSDWNPLNWLSATEFKFMYNPRNCYDAASESGCKESFNVDKCWQGCTAASWYRTSPYSVMWDQQTYQRLAIDPLAGWSEAPDAQGRITIPNYYNSQSIYAINQRFNEFQ